MTVPLSPDGTRLLAAGRGERQPRPFHYRWLLPHLLGDHEARWVWCSRLSMLAVSLLAVAYTHVWYAGLIPITLAGLNLNLKLPVLVDLPAMAVGLGAAVCAQHGWWPAAVGLALLAGTVKETTPVFAALWAWNPILLVGLAAPAVRAFMRAGAVESEHLHDRALTNPFKTALEAHAGTWRNPFLWLLPWGVLLIGLGRPTWQIGATVLVAYAQCAIATDGARLYQWAWPVLLARTFTVTAPSWWFLVVVVAVAWPFPGTGV